MKPEAFDELVSSVRQAGAIRRGEIEANRVFDFGPEDVRLVRKKLELTQQAFAEMIGVSVATLRNWEQGRRRPEGPAQALLRVAAKNPQVVRDALKREAV